MQDADVTGARAFREWVTGEPREFSRIFLLEPGAPMANVARVADRGDALLLPKATGPYRGAATAVRYVGAWHEEGDQIFLGEFGVELQDYITAAFIQIVGPTAVRFSDLNGWRAFLDDADLARRTGIFPSVLIDPRVLLADRGTLINGGSVGRSRTLRISSNGDVSIGMQGGAVGSVDDLPALLAVPRPATAAVTAIAPVEGVRADLGSRRWLGRYVRATDLFKMLRLANGSAKISGFGWRPVDDGLADAEPLPSDPLLFETAGDTMLADTTTLRRQRLSPVATTVVDITQTSSTADLASERVARQLDTSVRDARALCIEATTALGVNLGGRIPVSSGAEGNQR